MINDNAIKKAHNLFFIVCFSIILLLADIKM